MDNKEETDKAADLLKLAIIDELLFALVAKAAAFTTVDTVVVMPGVYETSRVREALWYAVQHKAKRFICTGTNQEERDNGQLYDEQYIRSLYPGDLYLTIEADAVGNHTRMQAQNAAKRLMARPPEGTIVQTGGSWHTPRSFLAFLQACIEEFTKAVKDMPTIYPLLVNTDLGSEIRAASDAHKASGYGAGVYGLLCAARTEIDRRLQYTKVGHLADLDRVLAYLVKLV